MKWKQIEGYNNYSISNTGLVKSFKRYSDGKIMSNKVDGGGYLQISIFNNSDIRKNVSIGRLVGLHFIPNPNN